MGTCVYCNTSAGMLRKVHKECEDKHNTGLVSLENMAAATVFKPTDSSAFSEQTQQIAAQHYVTDAERTEALKRGWEQACDNALEDGILTAQEEVALASFARTYSLDKEYLNQNGAWDRMVHAGALRDLMEGKIPHRQILPTPLPFNLQKGEELVWLFYNVRYSELRSHMHTPHSPGVRIRVAKGVYYRTSGFRGNPVQITDNVYIDTGYVGITTKHIYFAGRNKTFRTPYAKIVAFHPYSDALSFNKDTATAKPQILGTGDGWFIYNLVMNMVDR